MVLNTLVAQTIVSLCGAVAAETLHWYALSRKPQAFPKYAARPVYWITTIAMILFGGAMPLLYIEGSASALLCFHLGAATPVILQKLVAYAPSLVGRQGAGEISLRNFFRW
jgi:hypothetical protein